MVAMQPIKLELSIETKRALRDLTRALQSVGNLNRSDTQEYYNEETLDKVRIALTGAYPGPDDPDLMANNMITAMQNAGILFRERRP